MASPIPPKTDAPVVSTNEVKTEGESVKKAVEVIYEFEGDSPQTNGEEHVSEFLTSTNIAS
jgi:hypothetical protein